jgi:hypothetical protein
MIPRFARRWSGDNPGVADQKLLSIYLNDHYAGSTAGLELAKRVSGRNDGTRYGEELGRICREIEQDRDELRRLMDRLEVRPSRARAGAAWLGERLGRLKLNGQITGYSPLSRLVEIEGLLIGVTGKLELWRSLRDGAGSDPRLREVDLGRLMKRAESQRKRLVSLHDAAARDAFAEDAARDRVAA